jgi:hypothetical protein
VHTEQIERAEFLLVIAVAIGCIALCIVQGSQLKNFRLVETMGYDLLVHGCRLLCGARHLITNLQLKNVMHVVRIWCASVSY